MKNLHQIYIRGAFCEDNPNDVIRVISASNQVQSTWACSLGFKRRGLGESRME